MASDTVGVDSYREYQSLYRLYITAVERAYSFEDRTSLGVESVFGRLRSLVPPVWSGCCIGGVSQICGDAHHGSRGDPTDCLASTPSLQSPLGFRSDGLRGVSLVSEPQGHVGIQGLDSIDASVSQGMLGSEGSFDVDRGICGGVRSGGLSGRFSGVAGSRASRDSESFSSGVATRVHSKSLPRGPNYERNRINRLAKKAKKVREKDDNSKISCGVSLGCSVDQVSGSPRSESSDRGSSDGSVSSKRFPSNHVSAFSSVDDSVLAKLQETRAMRFIAENEVAVERSQRQLAVIRALDVDSEIKQKQIRTRASIEREMVSIEKTHSQLAASGNVPGDLAGFEATILSSNSISPNSSASLQEFRACQKALLDSEARVERMVAAMKEAGIEIPHGPRTLKSMEHGDGIWTDNTENRNEWDERYSAYGIQDAEMYGFPGKVRVIPC